MTSEASNTVRGFPVQFWGALGVFAALLGCGSSVLSEDTRAVLPDSGGQWSPAVSLDAAAASFGPTQQDAGAALDVRSTVDAQTVADVTLEVAECRAVCGRHGDWTPNALCEDYSGQAAGAYFCGSEPMALACAERCTRAVLAAPTPACRAAWPGYLSCLARAGSYAETVGGGNVECEPPIISLMSACWNLPAMRKASDLWSSKRPQAYRYRLRQSGPNGSLNIWTVRVGVGRFTQAPVSPKAPTIDEMYAEFETAMVGGDTTVILTTDASLGYPKAANFFKASPRAGGPPFVFARGYEIDMFGLE